jgi:putative peptidoglycan lipid II flippase
MVGLIVVGEPLVRVLFERGEFDADSTRMTYLALVFYTVGLWAFSGIRIMVSGFYALQDTRTPVKVAVVALVSNGVLGLTLMGPLKHGGLALALSAASSIQFGLLILFMRRRVPHGFVGPVAFSAAKCMVAALAMGMVVFVAHAWWLPVDPMSGLLRMILELLVLVGIGVMTYLAAAGMLRCRELRSAMDMVRPIRRGSR